MAVFIGVSERFSESQVAGARPEILYGNRRDWLGSLRLASSASHARCGQPGADLFDDIEECFGEIVQSQKNIRHRENTFWRGGRSDYHVVVFAEISGLRRVYVIIRCEVFRLFQALA